MTAASLHPTDPRLPAIIDRIKDGKTTLIAESKKLGYSHNGPLRAALRQLVGREQYDVLLPLRSRRKSKRGVENA